jgi:hypothetical protein
MTDSTRSAHELFGYRLHARDGSLGHVHDLFFDDRRWIVRYVVVDLHRWRPGRRVLISPVCVRHADTRRRRLDVSLGLDQIRRAPGVDADRPVSRQHEIALHEYYGIPWYWADEPPAASDDPHLRSMRAVRGYTAATRDAAVGHVMDFLIDSGWTVVALVVARRVWLSAPRRFVSVGTVMRVSWLGKTVYLDPDAAAAA